MRKQETVEEQILSLLYTDYPLRGTEIADALKLNQGTIYVQASRAKFDGLLKQTTEKAYQLTAFGERYTEWLAQRPTR